MRQADRLNAILDAVSRNGSVSVTSLAEQFGVSEATVRRDLGLLDGQRLVSRIHGGAIARGALYELPLLYREARHHDEKRRIAAEAATLVESGATVGLTGGTTTLEVARALCTRPRLTIVTNALNIASELAVRANLKIVVPGGVARPESYELVGPLAEANLAELNLDVAFIGVDGIGIAGGLTTHHEVEAYTNRALIRRARRVVCVADSSKLDLVAFARICGIGEIHDLITDSGAASGVLDPLREAGIAVRSV